MRKMILCLIALLPLYAFADNPFLGKWKVEVIAQKDAVNWEIRDDGTILSTTFPANAKKNVTVMQYEIDEDNREFTLSSDQAQSLRFRYSVEGDVFHLNLTDVENSSFYEDFLKSFTAPFAKSKDANSVTNDAYEFMKSRMKDLLDGLPMMKGYRQ